MLTIGQVPFVSPTLTRVGALSFANAPPSLQWPSAIRRAGEGWLSPPLWRPVRSNGMEPPINHYPLFFAQSNGGENGGFRSVPPPLGGGGGGNRSGKKRPAVTPYEERYRAVYGAGGDRFYSRQPSENLERFLASTKPSAGKALVIGCGEGRNIQPFVARNWEVIGIDSAPSGLKRAGCDYAGCEKVRLIEADALEPLPLEADSIDMVVLVEFLHLIIDSDDRKRLMAEVFRVLKSGGKIFFENNGRLEAAEVEYLQGGRIEPRTIQSSAGERRIQLERLPTVMLNGATLRREIEQAGLVVDEISSGTFQHPDTVREQIIVHGHKP